MKVSRLNSIEQYVISRETVSIDELCEVFGVSKNTIRRDLNELEVRGHITKVYGSLYANDDVHLSLNQGEILAVVGENGAGKSTLMKILYGLERPTAGEIYLNGELQHFRSPHDAIAKKIGMVQQHFMLLGPCLSLIHI